MAVPPTNAAFARVRVGVNATANGDVCTVDGTDVLLRFFSPQLYLPEYSTPGTFDPSLVYSSGGVLRLQAPNGSQVTWDGSALTFGNGDTATAFTSGTGQGQAFQSVWKASSGLVGPSIAGAPTDANAAGSTTLNGAIATDNTNSRWYTRVGGTWKFVAVAGERIPPSERRCPRCLRLVGLGQEAVGVVNEIQADHTRHMLWNHRRCGFRYRLARALRLVPDHTAWYTAAIRRVERRWVDRHELQVIEGGKVA